MKYYTSYQLKSRNVARNLKHCAQKHTYTGTKTQNIPKYIPPVELSRFFAGAEFLHPKNNKKK